MLTTPLRRLTALTPAGVPLARTIIRARIARLFGPPPSDGRKSLGDPGLYGPESASWRVVAEPAAIVGGIRALVIQLLHPLAMAGVADHSRYRQDALGRLHRTAGYVTATTFGSTDEALDAARRVRGAHRLVAGAAPDGRNYAASDPHLLVWVSLALTSSFLASDRAYAPEPLDAAAADAFVAEQSRAAALLDPRVDLDALAADPDALDHLRAGRLPLPMLERGQLPQSVDQVHACLEAYAPELRMGEQARTALRFLLWPDIPPAVRAAYLPLLGGALATLRPRERALLGLGGAAAVGLRPLALQTQALLAGMRLLAGVSPASQAAARRAGARRAA